MTVRMKAAAAKERYGSLLVGCTVFTETVGAWQRTRAMITEVTPDPAAEEIVFQVQTPSREVGVFEWEDVVLLDGD